MRRYREETAPDTPIPLNPLAAPPPHWRPRTLRAKAHRTQQWGVDTAAAKIGESWHCRPGQGPHPSHIPACWSLAPEPPPGKVLSICQCLPRREGVCFGGLPETPAPQPQLVRIRKPLGGTGLLWGSPTGRFVRGKRAAEASLSAFRNRLTFSSLLTRLCALILTLSP